MNAEVALLDCARVNRFCRRAAEAKARGDAETAALLTQHAENLLRQLIAQRRAEKAAANE
jgi:hypothetical protein